MGAKTVRGLDVDDEPDLREIAMTALDDPQNQVQTCDGGAAALAAIPLFDPNVILLDVMIPAMDGPRTLTAIRAAHGSELPVTYVTARAQPDDIAEPTTLGAVGLIEKPFDPLSLDTTINRRLG